ncbi:hypothetical protein ACFQDE_00850 [Deinococcus caeni]|uniref:hypothetical protein n=1 Tax=Deinococcus caeni TaxID=569127 RepID=UPI003608B629
MPADAAVYTGISTDHYPWTEVTADLAVRQSQEFSGVFDAWQGPRWARFVWTRGALLGGFTRAGQGLSWAAATQGLPRASVSLTELSPSLSDLLWSTRAAQARALPGAWPDPRAALERERFHGLLISGPHCSFWSSGRVLGARCRWSARPVRCTRRTPKPTGTRCWPSGRSCWAAFTGP